MRVTLTVVAFLGVLQLGQGAYKVKNYNLETRLEKYTAEERQALIEYQTNFLQQAKARSIFDKIEGKCDCDLDKETACGCCVTLLIEDKPKACFRGGLKKDPTELFVSADVYGITLFDIRIQPEICARIPIPGFQWIPIKLCVLIYNHDFCVDKHDFSFKLCFQVDVVILFTIFTIDFNCLWYHDGKLDIDDSMHTQNPGLITYKIGHGFSTILNARSGGGDNNTIVLQVGDLSKRLQRTLSVTGGKNSRLPKEVCCRLTKYKRKCWKPRKVIKHTQRPLKDFTAEEFKKLEGEFCKRKLENQKKFEEGLDKN